ncbi:MAG TPA: hypothetical protein VHH73_05160, partial [Verrucomicrobiae bacterium]|nr:hypothetical protein [Verrucomicrobiae bacterium]
RADVLLESELGRGNSFGCRVGKGSSLDGQKRNQAKSFGRKPDETRWTGKLHKWFYLPPPQKPQVKGARNRLSI